MVPSRPSRSRTLSSHLLSTSKLILELLLAFEPDFGLFVLTCTLIGILDTFLHPNPLLALCVITPMILSVTFCFPVLSFLPADMICSQDFILLLVISLTCILILLLFVLVLTPYLPVPTLCVLLFFLCPVDFYLPSMPFGTSSLLYFCFVQNPLCAR